MSHRYAVLLALGLVLGGDLSAQQRRAITGRVTDEQSGQPIPGAQVVIKGTNTGTLGRADGTFTLSVPAAQPIVLEISFIGFSRAEVRVAPTQNAVQVALKVDVLKLDELVVTGQATTVKRRNLANAVGTVNAREIAQVPAASISQALAGKMAGVNIIESSGAPGGASWVNLRGVTSINGAFTPLYVIDGVIASDIALPRATNFVSQASRGNTVATSGENAVNRIADLNPNDIENVEVLKGAAASAIYGSKASNGVIIITTKRGKGGAPQYSMTQRFGSAEVTKLMGLRRYSTLADAVARFGNAALDPVTGWKPDVFFDNERAVAGEKPLNFETIASVSGGTEDTRYYASIANKHEGGVVLNTFADKRSFKLNVDQNAGSRVQLGLGADIVNTIGDKGLTINENNNSSYWAALSNTPSFFDMRGVCPDGSRGVDCEGVVWPTNPYVASNALHTASKFKNEEEVWRFIGSGRATIEAIRNDVHTLRLLGNAGVDFFNQDNRVFSPPELQFEALDALLGTYAASDARNLNYNLNANAVYTFKPSQNLSSTTQVGMQYENRELRIERIVAANLIGGLETVLAGTQHIPDGRHELVRDIGYFAQQEVLTFNEKLLLTVGLRADKSSNNGDPDKLFLYPKASGSFRLPNLVRGLDELKFRGAFGQSGNQPLYGQKFTQLSGAVVGGLGAAQIGGAAAAENIVPERQRELEGGIDMTLFGARANIELTAYDKRITDLLLQRSLPTSYGFTGQFLNAGVLQTRGMELSISGLPIQTSAITWNPRVSFSRYRSTVEDSPVPRFGGGGFSGGSVMIEEGKSATQVVGRDTLANGTSAGFEYLGEVRPDYTLQFSSDLKVMGVGLSFVIDRQAGGTVMCLTCWSWDGNGQSTDYDAESPTPGKKLGLYRVDQFARTATVYIQDASYTKLREVTISYDMPRSVIDNVWGGARYARFTLSGRNLKTWTPYRGLDPESRWQPESGLARGMPSELWAYPPSRTLWAGLELGF